MTNKEISDLKAKLEEQYKYCPVCQERLMVSRIKKEEAFSIDCSNAFCDGIFVVIDFNGKTLIHKFKAEDGYYCGKCGQESNECNCND